MSIGAIYLALALTLAGLVTLFCTAASLVSASHSATDDEYHR